MRSMRTRFLGTTQDIFREPGLHSYVARIYLVGVVLMFIVVACGCSSFGSVRDDCEQMTGRCVCKAGIQGHKCTVCSSHNKILGPNGCVRGK